MFVSNPFLARLPALAIPSEGQRRERVFAVGRAFLAIGSLITIGVDPAVAIRYTALAWVCLLLYALYALLILILLRIRRDSTPAFRWGLHAIDTLCILLISSATGGPNNPFFFFFLFVLLTAAYRWGLKETLATAGASIVLSLFTARLARWGPGYPWHLLQTELLLDGFTVRATCLLTLGCLLGYLVEKQKKLRKKRMIIGELRTKAHPENGVRETLEGALRAILDLFDANRVILALQDATSCQAFLWEAIRAQETQQSTVQFSKLQPTERERYFFAAPGHSWWAVRLSRPRAGETFRLVALGSEGERLRDVACAFPEPFRSRHAFRSLLAVSFAFGEEWSGRLYLFDPRVGIDREAEVSFLQALVREVAPAVYTVYRVRRLRSRVRAMERARVSRELHDGVIQSLIAMEMRLDVLRRQGATDPARTLEEVACAQHLLQQEIVNLRELMQQMRPLELHPHQLLSSLDDLVSRFRRETGISARFDCDLEEEVALPARVCSEIARVLQEALVNVRKHSQARNVVVRFAREDGHCKLVIDDDGRGFEFTGRLSHAELDAARKGPAVIKERVRNIGGELAVESVPGRGARLEIALKAYG